MLNKISIIGAGGVGSSLGIMLLNRLEFNDLALIDIDADLASGMALDLEDCRAVFNFKTKISGGGDYNQIVNSDLVVITAGMARQKGMSRLDLLKINSGIVRDIAAKVKKNSPQAIIIVVTNPLDLITYLVAKEFGFDRYKVIGMGSSLDTNRLFNVLYNLTGVSVSSMDGFVYGAHSNDMIVEPKRVNLATKELESVLDENNLKAVEERVKQRGAEIVSFLKKGSARFGPAAACLELIEAIAYDKNELLPVSVLVNGEYGLKDICLGLPCLINRQGIAKIVEVDLTRKERLALEKSEKLFKECMT